MVKKVFFVAALGLPFAFVQAQEDYSKIFSGDYDKAKQFIFSEEKWMDDVIRSYHLSPHEVKAIVFPELIRFNSIQDKIETFALESLYIREGRAYANFSIGRFQVKPSFAENIEVDVLRMFGESELTKALNTSTKDTTQNVDSRAARLKRIKDKGIQLVYVCLFFKIMERKYSAWKTAEEKIKFFAAAYNSDYRKSPSEIRNFVSKRFFHTGFVASKKYSYADISWYYFRELK